MNDDAWKKYKRTGDVRLRNAITERYIGLVYNIARKMKERVPHNVAEDELVSAGFEGLLEAVRRFDPMRGIKFQTYAPGRVRGAMLDYLRRLDWAPRLTRSRANRIEKARVALERRNERLPMDAELAAALDIPIDRLDSLMAEVAHATAGTAPRRKLQRDDTFLPPEMVEDRDALGPAAADGPLDMATIVCRRLSRRERYVVVMYYAEELTLLEIALVLGLSKSMICQIHAKALVKLSA